MLVKNNINAQTLKRLPLYLNYIKSLPAEEYVSATKLANALQLNDVLVRKDLATVSESGKPKVGYPVNTLTEELERFLGYDDLSMAALVGVGDLGRAILNYNGFTDYGMEVTVAFDRDERLAGTKINGKCVLSGDKMANLCQRMKIHIAILTVPAQEAQGVCDQLIKSGIRAIWNFAPVTLRVPENVLVMNENMGASLAALSRHLAQDIKNEGKNEK